MDSPKIWGGLGVCGPGAFSDHGRGRCDASHWGYVIRGVVRVAYPDHDEVINGGDAYYVAPGHLAIELGDAALVDFSPVDRRGDMSTTPVVN